MCGQATPARRRADQMLDRVDLRACSEGAFEPADASGQRQQRVAGRVQRCRVVVSGDERAGSFGMDRELFLQRGHSGDVGCVVRVDEDPHADTDVGSVELVDREVVGPE